MTRLSWFKTFARNLIDRSNRTDWAPNGTEYWLDFERQLAATGCTAEQADLAISKVCNLAGIYPSDYRPRLLEAVRAIRLSGPTDASLGGREQAAAESKQCPECGGSGLSLRYSHGDGRIMVTAGLSVGGYCGSCPHGLHLAASNGKKTWAELGFPHSGRHCYLPSQWDAANNRPLPAPDPDTLFDREQLAPTIRRPRRRQDAPSSPRPMVLRPPSADVPGATPGRPPVGPDPILDREPQPF